MFSLNRWQQVALEPEPHSCDWLQQNPWMPNPTTSLPPSGTWPGAQHANGSPPSPGTMRSGGQHTNCVAAVNVPLSAGS
jgi:hypothetical protein